MKSTRADALRLILPFALRLATVDFFGTDDFRDLVEVVLGFDDVFRDRVEDERDDRAPFCAAADNGGSRRATAAIATPIRLSMYTFRGLRLSSFQEPEQVKARA